MFSSDVQLWSKIHREEEVLVRTRDSEVTVGVFECVLHTPTNGPVKARL